MKADQELSKREYFALHLLTAFLVEDRIAWAKDPGCFGNTTHDLAGAAVDTADALLRMLESEEAA